MNRSERLEKDFETLQSLAEQSAILEVEPRGAPPERYVLRLKGQGIARVSPIKHTVEWADEHEVEVRLPFHYPEAPPDIRWVTPLFHPNISCGGYLQLEDVGLPWSENVTLDVVAERLWDVARLAFMDLPRAVNPAAKRWLEQQEGETAGDGPRDTTDSDGHPAAIAFPVDPRPLRKIELPGARSNVVRYQRRGQSTVVTENAEAPRASKAPSEDVSRPVEVQELEDGVLIISDDMSDAGRGGAAHGDDDEVFYIGD